MMLYYIQLHVQCVLCSTTAQLRFHDYTCTIVSRAISLGHYYYIQNPTIQLLTVGVNWLNSIIWSVKYTLSGSCVTNIPP